MNENNNSSKFEQTLLDKTLEQMNKYKENENNKILQFFHVTILIITALLAFTKGENINMQAYYLTISISFVTLAYFFLYLTDICNANTAIHYYINNSAKTNNPNPDTTLLISSINKTIIFFWKKGRLFRNCGLFSIIIAYISLF